MAMVAAVSVTWFLKIPPQSDTLPRGFRVPYHHIQAPLSPFRAAKEIMTKEQKKDRADKGNVYRTKGKG